MWPAARPPPSSAGRARHHGVQPFSRGRRDPGDTPVYGVNTGALRAGHTPVPIGDLARLQGAIVRSHAAGTGAPSNTMVTCGGQHLRIANPAGQGRPSLGLRN